MKKLSLFLVLSISSIFSQLLYAEESASGWYGAYGIGNVDFDVFDIDIGEYSIEADDAINGSMTVGYEFGSGFSVEGMYTTSISKGDIGPIEVDVKSLGLYGAWRSPGDLYAKVTIGYNYGELESRYFEVDDEAVSAGIGFGYQLNERVSFEAEYTRTFFEEDLDFLSAKLKFSF